MINGIETREFSESNDRIMSKKKNISSNKNIEETKINFFDPS